MDLGEKGLLVTENVLTAEDGPVTEDVLVDIGNDDILVREMFQKSPRRRGAPCYKGSTWR